MHRGWHRKKQNISFSYPTLCNVYITNMWKANITLSTYSTYMINQNLSEAI